MKFIKINPAHPQNPHIPTKPTQPSKSRFNTHTILESIENPHFSGNFKLIVLRAQIELGVQIFVGFQFLFNVFFSFWSQYSRIVNNVNWFESENPWRIPKMMIFACQLQIDCSLSSDRGVLKALFFSEVKKSFCFLKIT